MLLTAKSTRISACLVVLILSIVSLVSTPILSASADVVSVELSNFEVSTKDGSYKAGDPLVAGVNYDISFTVNVAPGVNDTVIVQTDLARSGDRFWELLTPDYPGIDLASWQSGTRTFSFTSVPGTPSFVLTAMVPEDHTTIQLPNGEMLHRPGTISVCSLSLQTGGLIEQRTFEVIDKSILEYRELLSARENLTQEIETVPEYAAMVKDVIGQAEVLAKVGYTDRAIALLNTIPTDPAEWPELPEPPAPPVPCPPEPSDAQWFIVIGVLAVFAVIAFILLLRARSTTSFLKQRADDQAKKLEILESRVMKIGEKSLAGEIASIRDALKSMSGR